MKLTADLVAQSRIFFNCLNQRELDLRGHKITTIENLGACNDQVDAINLADNELRTLDQLPVLKRLASLFLSNNHLEKIGKNLGQMLPHLEVLVLTRNRINRLSELDNMSSCTSLRMLALLDNPVVHRENYRLYVIYKIPSLKTLDFRKVTLAERDAAAALFASVEGKEAVAAGDDAAERNAASARGTTALSARQQLAIKQAIQNAQTPAEVDRLERMLSSGIIPDQIISPLPDAGETAPNPPSPPPVASDAGSLAPAPATQGPPPPAAAVETTTGSKADATNATTPSVVPSGNGDATAESNDAVTETSDAAVDSSAASTTTQTAASPDAADAVVESSDAAMDTSDADVEGDAANATTPSTEWIDDLKVTELKKELKKRGADLKGLKLKKQLQEALRNLVTSAGQ